MIRQRRLLAFALSLALATLGRAAPTPEEIKARYRGILGAFSRERLKADAGRFAALGSRLAGSPGEAAALDLAEAELRGMGATVRREPFEVTVPDPAARGTILFGGDRTELLPLWPNLVRTSTCDVKGPLLYAGDGTLEALSGKRVEGAIVVMEFGTSARWRNAAKLGARAVIFLEPDAMPRAEAEAKFASVPLDTPRFYLPKRNAGALLTAAFAGTEASLSCRQDWVVRKSANLVAEFPGAIQQEPVALFVPADATSVVPALTPGGEGATGLAAALEVARVASARPHRRPLWVVVSGAHGLALRGAREFVERQFHGARSPFLTLTLDLSGGSPSLGSFGQGWFYEYRGETKQHVEQTSRLFRSHADLLSDVTGSKPARLTLIDGTNGGDSRTWKNNVPGKFALDCEPMLLAGLNALSFRTVEDGRETCDTPFDTLERVQVGNVFRQAGTVGVMLDHALNDTSDKDETSDYRIPLDRRTPERMSLVGGFTQSSGTVVVYDPQKSFVPDIAVPDSLACVLGGQKTMMGVRGDMIQATVGAKSQYEFTGIAPISSFPTNDKWVRMAAFHLDPKTGAIDHAPTENSPGFEAYHTEFPQTVARHVSPIVVFPCVTLSLFDLVDPQELKALPRMRILDAQSGAEPRNYGLFSPGYDQRLSPEIEDAQVAFLLKAQRFQILGGLPGESNRLILTNSSVGDEKGTGYAGPGSVGVEGRAAITEGGRFPDIALNCARDLCAINETRLDHFEKYRIVSAGVRTLHEQAVAAIAKAEAAGARMDWAESDRQARAAWGYALRAHPIIMGTANDVVNGVVFYLFLLIPFSYFLERLFFGHALLTKQLGAGVGIFVVSFLVLRFIHPAFEIVSNPSMIFIAFVMGVLSLVVTSFILGKFEANMRAVKAAGGGVHEVDVRRSSVAMAAFNLGVSNMRRRKARTILTTLTLVVMTFIVLSFTSIVDELRLDETPAPDNVAAYSGLMLRNSNMDPLQLTTFRQIANEFQGKATVVRRTYYYGADINNDSLLTLQRGQDTIDVRAMLGLDPDETKVTKPQEALFPGGRWFRPGDRNVAILPKGMADQLKVGLNEVGKARVTYAGEELTIIGIVDPGILRGKTDLDGDGLMPPDFSLSWTRNQQEKTTENAFRPYIRLDPDKVFIVPAATAMDLGSDLRTLAVAFADPNDTRPALESLMPRLRLNLYASVPQGGGLAVKQFSVQQAKASGGLVLVAIQILIAAVFVLNTMVASVVERTKEISIFSSIGLAPNHIAMLFFAESLVYGVLGSVAGYYVAQGTAKIIVATGWLPGLTLNFSSTSAVLSAGIVMATVLLSTIYPARKAAQIAAPAMNEKAFETEPDGDEWRLPLPFSISATEAAPLSAFLTNWLRAYEGYTIGDFVTADAGLTAVDGVYTVRATTWLAPYDLGVSQTLELIMSPSRVAGVYALDLVMVRLSGDPENWPVVNGRFLASVRRQFLTWRTLGAAERESYRAQAEGGEALPSLI